MFTAAKTLSALTLVSGLILFAAAEGKSSSSQPSAEELVRESATALSKLHSYELHVVSNQTTDDGKYRRTFHSYVDTFFEQSGTHKRIRIVSKKQQAGMSIVSDGSGYWIYHDSDRRYEHRTGDLPPELFRSPTPGFSGTLRAENLPNSMKSAEVMRQENVPGNGGPELCDVVSVHLKPNIAPPGISVQDNQLTLWLSRQYRIPMKVSATFLRNDESGKPQAMDMTITVLKFIPNPQLPPSTWAFIPPPGSQPEPGASPAMSKPDSAR